MSQPLNEISKALIKVDTKILELVYKDLAQPGVQKVGMCLSTVLGLGNTVLLPIKLLNEKARILYQRHMDKYKDNLEKIPNNDLVEVEPEIGVPILQNLEYTSNEKLSDLYINLLTNASDKKYVINTHPRFVKIIDNISPDEALILEKLNQRDDVHDTIPFITLRLHIKIEQQGIAKTHGIVDINEKYTDLEKIDFLRLPAKSKEYFENLVGLGLLNCETEKFNQGNAYDKLIADNREHIKNQKELPHISNVTILKGYYELTNFGKSFIKACRKNRKNENVA